MAHKHHWVKIGAETDEHGQKWQLRECSGCLKKRKDKWWINGEVA